MRFLLALTLLTACENDPLPDTYDGIDHTPSCSWDIIHPERGYCISDSSRYRCIREMKHRAGERWTHIACQPYSVWK